MSNLQSVRWTDTERNRKIRHTDRKHLDNEEVYGRDEASEGVLLKWPMGHPLGEPFKLDKQKEVLKAALELLVTAKEPGVIVEPGWKWKRW